jgi:hypothetical protein
MARSQGITGSSNHGGRLRNTLAREVLDRESGPPRIGGPHMIGGLCDGS